MLNNVLRLIRRLFTNSKHNSSDSECYDEEIKSRERNLELFHKIVGENPLKQIDWIIENGFEKFNQWYKSYEDGSIQLRCTESNRSSFADYSEFANQMQILSLDSSLTSRNYATSLSHAMEIGFTPGTKEDKEADSMLRQSLSAKDYRLYSPVSQIDKKTRTWGEVVREIENEKPIQIVELRAGIGNKVIARYEEKVKTYGSLFN